MYWINVTANNILSTINLKYFAHKFNNSIEQATSIKRDPNQ
jgi:hypothetical protein